MAPQLALALAAALLFSATPLAKITSLRPGMTIEQVRATVGAPTLEGPAENPHQLAYEIEPGPGYQTAVVTFSGDPPRLTAVSILAAGVNAADLEHGAVAIPPTGEVSAPADPVPEPPKQTRLEAGREALTLGDSYAAVRQRLGKPTRIVKASDCENLTKDVVEECWWYNDRNRDSPEKWLHVHIRGGEVAKVGWDPEDAVAQSARPIPPKQGTATKGATLALRIGMSEGQIQQLLGLPDSTAMSTCGGETKAGPWACLQWNYVIEYRTLVIYFAGSNRGWHVNNWSWL